jgi:hypothetical protein
MNTYTIYWSPEGRPIATVQAKTPRAAIRKAPYPYRRYLGEMYAVRYVSTIAHYYQGITTRSDGRTCHRWSIVLTYQGRTMKSPFFQGTAHTEAPTLYDVLESLFLDASVCKSNARRLRRLLGEDYETIRQETEDK